MIKRSESDWKSLFEAHDRSGLSAAAFCREQQLCPKYFSLRKKQLNYHGWSKAVLVKPYKKAMKKPSSFIPAVVPPELNQRITITTGPVTLKLPVSVDAHWLIEVIHGLR
jgi:hypothetical protein